MPSFNQEFKDYLVTQLAHDGALDDLIVEFLQGETASSSTDQTTLWNTYFDLKGYTGALPDKFRQYFDSLPLSGSHNDDFIAATVAGSWHLP